MAEDAPFNIPLEVLEAYPPFPSAFRLAPDQRDRLNDLLKQYLGQLIVDSSNVSIWRELQVLPSVICKICSLTWAGGHYE